MVYRMTLSCLQGHSPIIWNFRKWFIIQLCSS